MQCSSNFRGIVFMCLAMVAFSCNDALVKSVTGAMNVGQILFVRGLLTTLMVIVIARHFRAFRPLRTMMKPVIILRIIMEALASITYISALGQIPLANASAIMQALPLAVTLGAAVFLGEPVGWRRWTAIFVGFIGVLIVLRPGRKVLHRPHSRSLPVSSAQPRAIFAPAASTTTSPRSTSR